MYLDVVDVDRWNFVTVVLCSSTREFCIAHAICTYSALWVPSGRYAPFVPICLELESPLLFSPKHHSLGQFVWGGSKGKSSGSFHHLAYGQQDNLVCWLWRSDLGWPKAPHWVVNISIHRWHSLSPTTIDSPQSRIPKLAAADYNFKRDRDLKSGIFWRQPTPRTRTSTSTQHTT